MTLYRPFFKIFIFFSILSTSLHAQKDCRSVYKTIIEKKVETHEKINGYFPYTATTATVFAFINPLVSAVLLGAHYGAILITSQHGSEQANIFNLELLDSPYGQHLYKEITKLNDNLSNVDILRIINHGFQSGDFCDQLPDLYTIDNVSSYVVEKAEKWSASGRLEKLKKENIAYDLIEDEETPKEVKEEVKKIVEEKDLEPKPSSSSSEKEIEKPESQEDDSKEIKESTEDLEDSENDEVELNEISKNGAP